MKKNKTLYVALTMAIALFFSSCGVPAYVKATRNVNNGFNSLANRVDDDVKSGKLTYDIGERLKRPYEEVQRDLNKDLDELEDEMNPFKKKEMKENLLRKLVTYQRTINTLNKLYDLDRFKSFSMNLLFPIGKYKIPEGNRIELNKMVEPLIDDIIKNLDDSTAIGALKVVIVVSGHSDEAAIDPNSTLAKELSTTIGSSNPTMKELNEELSSRRAKEFVKVIEEQLLTKRNYQQNRIKFEVNEVKRGYDKPYQLENMNKVDERRRVVTIIWNVVPELITQ